MLLHSDNTTKAYKFSIQLLSDLFLWECFRLKNFRLI